MPQLESLTLHSSDPSIFKWRRLLWRWLLLLYSWWCKSPREIYRRQCTEDVKGFNLTSSPVSKNSFFQPKWMTTLQTQDEKPFWVDESMVHLCARKVILLLFKINCITLCYFLHCCPKIQFWPKLDLFEFCVKIEG